MSKKESRVTIRLDEDMKEYINDLPISVSEFMRSLILEQMKKENPEDFIVRQKEKKRLTFVRQKDKICKTISKLDEEISEQKSIIESKKKVTRDKKATDPKVIEAIEIVKQSIDRNGVLQSDVLTHQAKLCELSVSEFKEILHQNDIKC